ncbi:ESPR-type extended signal peptide-containing protein [Paraburkholderia bonniea]|uniref:ESPR-type extended signal peptide-containing protein n=1 Tax=Paraburkholderia bonniea TaxID=2152891 RepID=UPI00129276BD|nr:ESPR-type extended signal peptide-containing protein [Paraburkholderia bonniea]
MNKIYRTLWNATTQSWSAASELARGQGKGSGANKMVLTTTLASAIAGMFSTSHAVALESDPAMLETPPAVIEISEDERLDKTLTNSLPSVLPQAQPLSTTPATVKFGQPQALSLASEPRLAAYAAAAIVQGEGATTRPGQSEDIAIGNSAVISVVTGTGKDWLDETGRLGSVVIGNAAKQIVDSEGSTGGGVAIGDHAKTTRSSVAIGTRANASGNIQASAVGTYSNASGPRSSAFGYAATSSADSSIALGISSTASAKNAVALGNDSLADGESTVSIGNATLQRRITRMAKGTADTDAVNVSQLKGIATALGGGAEVNADGSIKAPNYTIQGTGYTSIGEALTKLDGATTTNTTNITNLDAKVDHFTSGLAGLVQQDPTSKTITVASATDGRLINLAGTAGPRVLSGIANGTGDTDAVSIAQLKSVGVIDPTGKLLTAVVYDDLTLGRVTMGGSYGTVIGNVADGLIAASSKEAINGSQLFTLKQEMEKKFTALDADITNLGDKITNLSGDVTNLNTLVTNKLIDDSKGTTLSPGTGSGSHQIGPGATAAGTNSLAIGPDAKANSNNSVALGPGSVADRDNTISVGSAGNERQITNVAAGTAPTDAVNLNQLNSRFNSAQNAINSVARNAYAGAAAAMAMPNITPSGPGRTVIAAGAANYKSGSATAASITYRSLNSRWLINGAISVTSTGDAAVRTQIGYEF